MKYLDDCHVTLKPPERALGDTASPALGGTGPRTLCHELRDKLARSRSRTPSR